DRTVDHELVAVRLEETASRALSPGGSRLGVSRQRTPVRGQRRLTLDPVCAGSIPFRAGVPSLADSQNRSRHALSLSLIRRRIPARPHAGLDVWILALVRKRLTRLDECLGNLRSHRAAQAAGRWHRLSPAHHGVADRACAGAALILPCGHSKP